MSIRINRKTRHRSNEVFDIEIDKLKLTHGQERSYLLKIYKY